MSLATLIIVSALQSSAPGILPSLTSQNDLPTCQRNLSAAMEGIKITYIGNSTGVNHDLQTTDEQGWKVIRTPAGRVIATLKCEGQK